MDTTALFPNKDKLEAVLAFMNRASAFHQRKKELKDVIEKAQRELEAIEEQERELADNGTTLVRSIPTHVRAYLLGDEDEDAPAGASEEAPVLAPADNKVWLNMGANGLFVEPTDLFYCACDSCKNKQNNKDKRYAASSFGKNFKGEHTTSKHPGGDKPKPAPAQTKVCENKKGEGCKKDLPYTLTYYNSNGAKNKLKPLCRVCMGSKYLEVDPPAEGHEEEEEEEAGSASGRFTD